MGNTRAKVIACVNHDANAIASHLANHPETKHFTEDIRDFAVVVKIKKIVDAIRKRHPDCFIKVWASLECTNFSNAKGGLPKDAEHTREVEQVVHYTEEDDWVNVLHGGEELSMSRTNWDALVSLANKTISKTK